MSNKCVQDRVVLEFRVPRKTLRMGPQDIATVKGRCGTEWIKELSLFHISIYELNSRA